MRYCNCLDKDIIQECKTDLGGIDKIYLINADDYIRADGDTIYLKEGKMAYRIDHANNMANLTQNAVNTNDQTYINSVLTFTLRFHSTNLEDEMMCLTLGYFKVLVKYKNGYWRFVDEESSDWSFKQTAVVNDSGTTENDMNCVQFTFELNGHSYGLLYEEMPNIVISHETDPHWEVIDVRCETEEIDDKPQWEIIDEKCEEA